MARVTKRAVRPEDTWKLANVFDPRISPDGRQVAYVVSRPDREQDRAGASIWLAPLDGKGKPRAFTHEGHARAPRWAPDGGSLAFIRNLGKGSRLMLAPLDGGEPRELSTGPGSVQEPCWSPDGKRIAYLHATGKGRREAVTPAERNAPVVVRDLYYRFDGAGLYDARRRHLFTIDVESGEERQLTDGDWHDAQPSWSPDSKQLVFISDRSPDRWDRLWRSDVYVVSARGGRVRRLTRGRGAASHPLFSPDGTQVAAVGHEHGDHSGGRNTHLMLAPVRGRASVTSLTADSDLSVMGSPLAPLGAPFSWRPDGTGLLFLAGDAGAVAIFSVDRASGAVKKIVEAELQAGALSVSSDGARVAFCAAWSSELPEVFAASLRGESRPRRVSDANTALRREIELVPTRRIRYPSFDGLEIEAFVLQPPAARRGAKLPLALEIHGGPHGAHPMAMNPLRMQALAAAGYVVLMPNPRGSASYGEEFCRACVGDWGGGDYRDLMAGVDELIRRGIADPERLYVGGYSYGGYMSAWMVGQTDRFRAAAVGAPITNLASSFGNEDIPHASIAELGGTPWSNAEAYRERSPISYVENIKTPVQLSHWEGDLRCPIGQSEELYTALKLRGVPVEFVRYPGGSHVGRTPSQDIDSAERLIAWYDKHAPRKRARR